MPRLALAVLAAIMFLAAPLFLAGVARAQTASTTAPTDATSTEDISSSTPAILDPFNTDAVEAYVRAYFADIPVMVAVAQCESGFRQYNENGNPLYGGTGGMVGVFQEAAAVHEDTAKSMGLDINTLDGNLAYARYLFDTNGLAPWLASAHCWSPIKTTLSLGSSGQQVVALQEMLNGSGYVITKDGPGSPGQESTNFGALTQDAVERFQCAQSIVCKGSSQTTGYGAVGIKTRLALLKISGQVAFATSSTLSER